MRQDPWTDTPHLGPDSSLPTSLPEAFRGYKWKSQPAPPNSFCTVALWPSLGMTGPQEDRWEKACKSCSFGERHNRGKLARNHLKDGVQDGDLGCPILTVMLYAQYLYKIYTIPFT